MKTGIKKLIQEELDALLYEKGDEADAETEGSEEHNFYIVFSYTETGGGISPGQEGESWPDREPSYRSYNWKYASKRPPKTAAQYEQISVDSETFNSDNVFVSIIYYSTGDTFGIDYGRAEILGAFSTPEAAEAYIEKRVDGEGYKPWEGYFESLESRDVEMLPVLK